MTDYRIVPVKPTEEMLRAWFAEEYEQHLQPAPDPAKCYAVMLSAAPAVDREKVARAVCDTVGHYRMSESMALIVADAILALFVEGE